MTLDSHTCYRALKARDARFDGRFFVAVSSTRIYCRPVCTVRPPMRKNCRFYPSAAAAESGGYRPCLRCRPELAPGNASVDATTRLAQAAASMMEDRTLEKDGLDTLAVRLGITDRHLRRAFGAEFGVSPVEFAQTQRLLLAKRLLTDTGMAVVDVAMASGFASLRRFNHLFRTRYRMTPGQLRRDTTRTGIVGTDQDPARAPREGHERLLQGLERTVAFEVIGLDVVDHRDRRGEGEESLVILVGFHNEKPVSSRPRVASPFIHSAPGDSGRGQARSG